MDNQLVWEEEFNIGVDIIDQEHKRLFKIVNRLFDLKEDNKGQWACQEGIKYFKEHAIKHFEDEENYMKSIHYKEYKRHKRIHDGFRQNTLPSLEEELERTDYSAVSMEHFLGVCTGWLVGHTLTEDQAIVKGGVGKWDNLLPVEEREAVKQVIQELLHDMFRLESQVVSETYGGEKFGKGVYYRLIYNTNDDDQKWEIILVFEEQLLINTIGKVMGIQTNKLDRLLINAARYTSRQFLGRVSESLPQMKLNELEEENLLTYEQLRDIFEKENMRVSLLLDTGKGYFAYCAIAPYMPQDGLGTPIEAENAMKEVEDYLTKREKPKKHKILVVDDSMTMRQGMKELLSEDYEIAVAQSGMSAIRSITLDRPDLVLLDYEMPVCDGRQILEMIRAEDELAALPVIFLTGRTDQESVRKVVTLKPAGYLSKLLKPEDIKRKIDKFFEMEQIGKKEKK